MKHSRRYPKGNGPVHPAVTFYILTAYVWDLLPFVQIQQILTPVVTVRPDVAHYYVATEPWVDVRATTERAAYLSGREHECEWVVTVVAHTAEIAYDAFDLALSALIDDVRTGRIDIGRHHGTHWTVAKFQHPVEAMTQRYHEDALRIGRLDRAKKR